MQYCAPRCSRVSGVGCCHENALASELEGEETIRAAETAAHARGALEAAAEREAAVGKLQAQVRLIKVETRNMHADLMGRLKVAVQSKLILEKQHAQCAMGGRTRGPNTC